VANCIRRGGFYYADTSAAIAFINALTREKALECLRYRLNKNRETRDAFEPDRIDAQGNAFELAVSSNYMAGYLDDNIKRLEELIKEIETTSEWDKPSVLKDNTQATEDKHSLAGVQ